MIVRCAGVRVAVLMSWQERLSSLRTLGYHELALSAGLSVLAAAKIEQRPASPAVTGTPEASRTATKALRSAPWPAEGGGADVAAVSQALTSLLKGHVCAVLTAGSASPGAQACLVLVPTHVPTLQMPM
jgi:hypothetical protein